MTKRLLSMMLAGVLALSVSSVSHAANEDKELTQTKDGKYATPEIVANGAYEAPVIKVELSDTSAKKVAINPYGLEVNIKGTMSGGPEQSEQLVNSVESITNKSDVALAVNATVSAALKGNAKLAASPVQPTEKSNAIFAYLQVDVGDTIDADTEYNAKNANQAVFAAKEASKKAMVTLKDANQAAGSKASYKILGNVAGNPAQIWTSGDGVDFKIVFDFEPRLLSD